MNATCAECGHLHFISPTRDYAACPIDGCDCEGQEWARNLEYADVDEAGQLALGVPGEQRTIDGLREAIQWQNDRFEEHPTFDLA